MLSIYVEPELAAAVRQVTTHDGTTIQDKGEQLFRDYVNRADNRRPHRVAVPAPNFDDVCTEQPTEPKDNSPRKFTHKGYDI